jgi:3'(2'), 5'-bisphosphate nucleotidase
LAAGHAILKAAGGNIFTLDGEQISYGHINRKFLNPNFIASKEYPFE